MQRRMGMGHLSEQRFRQYVSVMEEKEKGFAISQSRRPRGFAEIHIDGKKAKLHLRVKNLTKLNNKEGLYDPNYYVLLADGEGDFHKGPLKVGVIEVDNRGEGEGRWEFTAQNIMGSARNIESFGRLIIAAKEKAGRFKKKIVLSGELELEVADSFDGFNMEKVDPFGQAMPNHRWWKFYPNYLFSGNSTNFKGDVPVTLEEAEAEIHEPATNQEIPLGPVFRGHQLIGLNYDEKGAVSCLVHGIPGRFCAQDQPDGGSSGYVVWQPLPGQSYKEGCYGYWLVHIDPDSGEVVYPKKATPPPGRRHLLKDNED